MSLDQRTRIDWADYTWQQIPGFENYQACREGFILSRQPGKPPLVLNPIRKDTGYLYVFFYRDGRQIKKYVHDLILLAFVGFPGPGQECRHLDRNRAHDELSNLQWGTKLENTDDRRQHRTIPRGEKSGTHKLTEVNVLEIRKLYGSMSLRELGKRFGVSHTTIRRAALGIKWGHLQ